MSSDPKQKIPAEELARGWATLRMQAALMLMFFGAVAVFSLILDQFFEFQRPTRPLVALTMGPALIAAGYLLLRSPKPPAPAEPSATPEPRAVPARQRATDLWAMILGPAVLVGLAIYGPFWGDFWLILGGI